MALFINDGDDHGSCGVGTHNLDDTVSAVAARLITGEVTVEEATKHVVTAAIFAPFDTFGLGISSDLTNVVERYPKIADELQVSSLINMTLLLVKDLSPAVVARALPGIVSQMRLYGGEVGNDNIQRFRDGRFEEELLLIDFNDAARRLIRGEIGVVMAINSTVLGKSLKHIRTPMVEKFDQLMAMIGRKFDDPSRLFVELNLRAIHSAVSQLNRIKERNSMNPQVAILCDRALNGMLQRYIAMDKVIIEPATDITAAIDLGKLTIWTDYTYWATLAFIADADTNFANQLDTIERTNMFSDLENAINSASYIARLVNDCGQILERPEEALDAINKLRLEYEAKEERQLAPRELFALINRDEKGGLIDDDIANLLAMAIKDLGEEDEYSLMANPNMQDKSIDEMYEIMEENITGCVLTYRVHKQSLATSLTLLDEVSPLISNTIAIFTTYLMYKYFRGEDFDSSENQESFLETFMNSSMNPGRDLFIKRN